MQKEYNKKKTAGTGTRGIVLGVLLVLVAALATLAFRLVFWVFANWGNLQADELVYTMTASLSGTNPAMIKDAVLFIAPSVVAVAVVIACLLFLVRKRADIRRVISQLVLLFSLLTLATAFVAFALRIHAPAYINNLFVSSDFIETYYTEPEETSIIFPEEKRNLIYIFIESLETTYADEAHGGAMSENVIEQMTALSPLGEDFSGADTRLNGGEPLYGSTYTMGGLFAQSSGLPLKITNGKSVQKDGFLPGFVTLGDILEEEGYRNVFMIGTDAYFGNRKAYFEEHGAYEICDFHTAQENGEIPADYSRAFWGYDDYLLYENAKTKLGELAAGNEPFNFTMLTVDTHAEDGYRCPKCEDVFGDQYANAFACASSQCAEFIAWIMAQDFYENTTVVISGDHCTMDSDFCDAVSQDYIRRAYTLYLNAAATPRRNDTRVYSTMDDFPTTLAALGADIKGDRLGLGTNLFSARDTLLEELGREEMNEQLARHSDWYVQTGKTS